MIRLYLSFSCGHENPNTKFALRLPLIFEQRKSTPPLVLRKDVLFVFVWSCQVNSLSFTIYACRAAISCSMTLFFCRCRVSSRLSARRSCSRSRSSAACSAAASAFARATFRRLFLAHSAFRSRSQIFWLM